MDDETHKRFQKETTEQFAALGRFIQAFEHVVGNLRWVIAQLVQDPARALFHQKLMWTVLHHQAMTAMPLADIARGLTHQVYGDKTTAAKVMDYFHGEFQELTKLRNKVVHGHWTIGYAHPDDTDFSEIGSLKGSIGKSSIKFDPIMTSLDEIDICIDKCKSLNALLLPIPASISFGHDINTQYQLENGVWKSKWQVP